MNKHSFRQVTLVLHGTWDPIDVSDAPGVPDDEYEEYVGGVLHLLWKGPSEDAVVDHLLSIEREELGLKGDPVRARRAAQALLALGKR
jgi:hypothetical protein